MFRWPLVLSFYATIGIPLLYLFNLFLISRYPSSQPFWVVLIGILCAMIGLTIWVWSHLSLGKSFGVLPKKQKKIKKGIYRYTKHPMYIGIWFTFFGLGLAKGSLQSLVFLNFFLVPLLIIRSKIEESLLYN